MRDLWIVRVRTEDILLVVGGTEDVVACSLNGEDYRHIQWTESNRVHAEVFGLNGVDKWYPDQVAKGEHEAEAISGQVHCSENGGLHVQSIENVHSLGDDHNDCRHVS